MLNAMCQPEWSGEEAWGKNGYMRVRMAESLCCLPETTTTLLITYTSMKKVYGVKKIRK